MATLGYTTAYPGANEPTAIADLTLFAYSASHVVSGVVNFTRAVVQFDGVDAPEASLRVVVLYDFLGTWSRFATSETVTGIEAGVPVSVPFATPVELPTGTYLIGFFGVELAGLIPQWADASTEVNKGLWAAADFPTAPLYVLAAPDTPVPTDRPWLVYLTDEPEEEEPAASGTVASGASGIHGGGGYGASPDDAFAAGTGGGDADATPTDGQLKRSGVVGEGGYS